VNYQSINSACYIGCGTFLLFIFWKFNICHYFEYPCYFIDIWTFFSRYNIEKI